MPRDWPECPDCTSLKRTLERVTGELEAERLSREIATETLALLASHVEWSADGKAELDTEDLAISWESVERVLQPQRACGEGEGNVGNGRGNGNAAASGTGQAGADL